VWKTDFELAIAMGSVGCEAAVERIEFDGVLRGIENSLFHSFGCGSLYLMSGLKEGIYHVPRPPWAFSI
jgi:hypothetical protein